MAVGMRYNSRSPFRRLQNPKTDRLLGSGLPSGQPLAGPAPFQISGLHTTPHVHWNASLGPGCKSAPAAPGIAYRASRHVLLPAAPHMDTGTLDSGLCRAWQSVQCPSAIRRVLQPESPRGHQSVPLFSCCTTLTSKQKLLTYNENAQKTLGLRYTDTKNRSANASQHGQHGAAIGFGAVRLARPTRALSFHRRS